MHFQLIHILMYIGLFDDMLTNGNTFLSRELDPMPISVEKKIKAANPNYFCTAILAFGYRGLTF